MSKNNIKKSLFSRIRNNFIAGIVVSIPIGITIYLTLFVMRVSSKLIPKEINPNNYLPFDIPGLEILIALLLITIIVFTFIYFILDDLNFSGVNKVQEIMRDEIVKKEVEPKTKRLSLRRFRTS